MLHIWPPLPLLIRIRSNRVGSNIIAALEKRDRVRWLVGDVRCFQVKGTPAAMLEPFPELTHLCLRWHDHIPIDIPETFLGGSAPRLQFLRLSGAFWALPKFLLSTSDLVHLYLRWMPITGYISPEAIVTGLSALTRLETLSIVFQRPALCHDFIILHSPPQTLAVLPSLTDFEFRGISGYLGDLVTQIDAPQLQRVILELFDQLNFQFEQLPRFICFSGMLRSFGHAKVAVGYHIVNISLHPRRVNLKDPRQWLKLKFGRPGLGWQVSLTAHLCSQLSFLLSSVEQLDILTEGCYPISWVNTDNTQWLELFQPFTAVRTLRVSHDWQSFIVSALQELTEERAIEVLPGLNSIYLEAYQPCGSEQQALEPFITARQHSGRAVAVYGNED
jgi:hypothetical protein